jgi:hypothetical protein
MTYLLVYKDPDNGSVRGLPVPLPDVPPHKVKATILEWKAIYKYKLPQEKEGEPIHYMLLMDPREIG